ncbi:hypothetical protein Tco_0701731 [Tanacetum coccineum]
MSETYVHDLMKNYLHHGIAYARLRIVSERVDVIDNLILSVTFVVPSDRSPKWQNPTFLKSTDKSTWEAKDVDDTVLSDNYDLGRNQDTIGPGLVVRTGQPGNGSAGAKASTSNRVGESNVVGESSGGQAVEPRRVNDKSRDHMEKYHEGMTGSHGENVESHLHNEEL